MWDGSEMNEDKVTKLFNKFLQKFSNMGKVLWFHRSKTGYFINLLAWHCQTNWRAEVVLMCLLCNCFKEKKNGSETLTLFRVAIEWVRKKIRLVLMVFEEQPLLDVVLHSMIESTVRLRSGISGMVWTKFLFNPRVLLRGHLDLRTSTLAGRYSLRVLKIVSPPTLSYFYNA